MIEHIIDGMAAEYKLDRGTAERILLLGLAMQTDDPLQVQAPGQTTSQTPTEQAGPIGSQPTRQPTPEELAASKQESPPARKVDPWWYLVGIWNFITDPIWIWNMSKISTAVVVGAGGVGAGQAIKGIRARGRTGTTIIKPTKTQIQMQKTNLLRENTAIKNARFQKIAAKYPKLSKLMKQRPVNKPTYHMEPIKPIEAQLKIPNERIPTWIKKTEIKIKGPQLTQKLNRLQKLKIAQQQSTIRTRAQQLPGPTETPIERAIARTKAAKITANKLRIKTKSPQLTQRVSRLQKLQTIQKLEQLEKAKIRMNLISQGEKAAPGEIKALKNIIKAGTSPEAEKAALQAGKLGNKIKSIAPREYGAGISPAFMMLQPIPAYGELQYTPGKGQLGITYKGPKGNPFTAKAAFKVAQQKAKQMGREMVPGIRQYKHGELPEQSTAIKLANTLKYIKYKLEESRLFGKQKPYVPQYTEPTGPEWEAYKAYRYGKP